MNWCWRFWGTAHPGRLWHVHGARFWWLRVFREWICNLKLGQLIISALLWSHCCKLHYLFLWLIVGCMLHFNRLDGCIRWRMLMIVLRCLISLRRHFNETLLKMVKTDNTWSVVINWWQVIWWIEQSVINLLRTDDQIKLADRSIWGLWWFIWKCWFWGM